MLAIVEFLHYLSIALASGITALSVGIGQGIVGSKALIAINSQPKAKDDIQKISLLGTALIETSAIIGFTISIILIVGTDHETRTIYTSISELGIAFAISVTGFIIGLISSIPAKNACLAAARQPFFGNKILRLMLISQSMIETPVIFSFIIAMFIKNLLPSATNLETSLKLLASGLAIGIGSIGPSLGLGRLAKSIFTSIGENRKAYPKMFTFMLVNGAIIETPTIFSLLVSMLILAAKTPITMVKAISLIAGAICIGIGTLGPGFSSGNIASHACSEISKKPELYSVISKLSIFAQSITETAAIYAFIIALLVVV